MEQNSVVATLILFNEGAPLLTSFSKSLSLVPSLLPGQKGPLLAIWYLNWRAFKTGGQMGEMVPSVNRVSFRELL